MRPVEIIAEPPHAKSIMAQAADISVEQAHAILVALARAGFVIAPLEPTNAMFEAYMTALATYPKRRESILQNIGKARRRWKAMAAMGMKVTFSDYALVGQLEGYRNSTPDDAGSSPAERATIHQG